MFNLGMGEITVILVLALLFIGPSKLPELASGLGKFIRQIRKTTADVKNEIVLDDSFRKPFEELRDAVTLAPEELKRRDLIRESLEQARRQAEELERANAIPADDGPRTPPPEPTGGTGGSAPPVAAADAIPTSDASWPPPLPPPPAPPVAPPVGTFPRSPTPAPLPPGRLGGSQRITPPVSSLASNRANITQVLTEEDLKPANKGAPPPLPPPLPGRAAAPTPRDEEGLTRLSTPDNPDQEPDNKDPDHKRVDDARMSFLEHLYDLRKRLRNAALIFMVVTIGSFFFAQKYFEILTRPARVAWTAALGKEPTFIYTHPTEAFWVYTKLAMYAAILIASPFIIWELWKFVAPGLYKKEKRMALTVTLATASCFVGGAIFGYVLISKPALTFLFGLSETFTGPLPFKIEPMVKMEELVGFMMAMLLGTGVAFELPVVLAVLGWLGLVTSRGLWKFNKYALILSAVVGGVLTPGPDILSQLLMAGPLYGLFNVSIMVVWLIERARRKKLEAMAKETGADLVPSG